MSMGYPCVFERLELDRLVCFLQYVAKYKIRQNTAWIVRHILCYLLLYCFKSHANELDFPICQQAGSAHFLVDFFPKRRVHQFFRTFHYSKKNEITSLFFAAYDIRVVPNGVIRFLLFLMYHLLNEFPPLLTKISKMILYICTMDCCPKN